MRKKKPAPKLRPRDVDNPLVAKLLAMLERKDLEIQRLTQLIVDLKRDGFQPKPEPPKPRKVRPPEQSDEELVRIRDREFIDRMTLELMKEGHGEKESRAEATRIRNETRNTTVQPSGNS